MFAPGGGEAYERPIVFSSSVRRKCPRINVLVRRLPILWKPKSIKNSDAITFLDAASSRSALNRAASLPQCHSLSASPIVRAPPSEVPTRRHRRRLFTFRDRRDSKLVFCFDAQLMRWFVSGFPVVRSVEFSESLNFGLNFVCCVVFVFKFQGLWWVEL